MGHRANQVLRVAAEEYEKLATIRQFFVHPQHVMVEF
jgi:hypothetical protein